MLEDGTYGDAPKNVFAESFEQGSMAVIMDTTAPRSARASRARDSPKIPLGGDLFAVAREALDMGRHRGREGRDDTDKGAGTKGKGGKARWDGKGSSGRWDANGGSGHWDANGGWGDQNWAQQGDCCGALACIFGRILRKNCVISVFAG